jgi:hypothetical protein
LRKVSPRGGGTQKVPWSVRVEPFRDHLAIRLSNTLAIALSIEGPAGEQQRVWGTYELLCNSVAHGQVTERRESSMAYAEYYGVDCLGLDGGSSRTYDFMTTPLPGRPTDKKGLTAEAKSNLTKAGLAKPPYTGIIFNVRLVRVEEILVDDSGASECALASVMLPEARPKSPGMHWSIYSTLTEP